MEPTLIGCTVTNNGRVERIVEVFQNDDGTLEIDTEDPEGRRWHYAKCAPTRFALPSGPLTTEIEVEIA